MAGILGGPAGMSIAPWREWLNEPVYSPVGNRLIHDFVFAYLDTTIEKPLAEAEEDTAPDPD